MQVIRLFPSIGHGGFYIEKFVEENFVMVYDCGSTNFDTLEKEINELDIEKIDLLFISHFDDDHVNGISTLCKKYKIENVVMPDLYEFRLIYLAQAVGIASSMDTLQLLTNPKKFFKSRLQSEPNFYFITENADDLQRENNNEEGNLRASGTNLINEILIKSNPVKSNPIDWVMIPFNYNKDVNSKIIKTQIENLLKNQYGQADIDEQWIIEHMDVVRKEFNNIFKQYNKDIKGDTNYSNVNSLVLYSGPSEVKPSKIKYNCTYKYLNSQKPGFIYCGDYNARDMVAFKELMDCMNAYEDLIGGVQIPHHGSKNNYNPKFAKNKWICIVSVGVLKGRHKCNFPNEEVAVNILESTNLIQVTDQSWTKFEQEIKW